MINVRKCIQNITRHLTDLLFPQKSRVRALSKLTPTDITSYATRSTRSPETHITALYDYHSPLIHILVRELKYRGNPHAVRLLGDVLHEELMEITSNATLFSAVERPILIPLPLAPPRLHNRGFNQINLLIDRIMERDGGKNFDARNNLLIKKTDTRAQTQTSSRQERLNNLRGAFSIKDSQPISNRDVILLDDVTTTGATLSEARAELLRAGARRVLSVAVAH